MFSIERALFSNMLDFQQGSNRVSFVCLQVFFIKNCRILQNFGYRPLQACTFKPVPVQLVRMVRRCNSSNLVECGIVPMVEYGIVRTVRMVSTIWVVIVRSYSTNVSIFRIVWMTFSCFRDSLLDNTRDRSWWANGSVCGCSSTGRPLPSGVRQLLGQLLWESTLGIYFWKE